MKEFLQQALTALENAKDAVECWSGYASEYFQKKHDLDGDIAGIDADMEKLRVAIDSLTQQDAQPVRAGPCEPAPELPPPEPLTGFDAWLADFTKVNAVTKQWVEGARFVWNMQPVQAEIADLTQKLEDYKEVHASHRATVRKIDVILNGEAGAAKQASLCDLVRQIEDARKDAERYRWLRSDDIEVQPGQREISVVMHRLPFTDDPDVMLLESELDAAIDAAMTNEG